VDKGDRLMGEFIEAWDFKKLFIEYFLGSAELAIFSFIILISFVCAKFNMSNNIFLLILLLTSLIFSFILGQAIYIIIILVVGFITFKSIGRLLT
jgi:hypothetical protein